MASQNRPYYGPVKTTSRGYYCKICKGSHASTTTLRQCFQDYYADRGEVAPPVPLAGIGMNMTIDPPAMWANLTKTNIPTGNYLISVTVNGAPKAIHIRIGAITTGKWTGIFLVSLFDDSKNKLIPILKRDDRAMIIDKLQAGNWQRALSDYGRTFSQCPICEKPLPLSDMKMGIHRDPECYSQVYR